MRRLSFCSTLAALLCVSAFGSAWAATLVREAPEYTVKAAYILLFTRYVEWPPAAFASLDAPIEILVLGEDPFDAVLDSTVAGMKSGGRPIVTRRAQTLAPGERAHVVYFGPADPSLQQQWLETLQDAPVLTIVNETSAVATDAVLTFVTEMRRGQARVRFDVNLASMRRAGVRINSQMLASARRVVRDQDLQEARR